MAVTQKYGIKYPFTSDNDDGTYIDLNQTYADGIKSQVLHVIFTPKGQKLRDPEFGTDIIRYVYSPSDSLTFNEVKNEISEKISKYVPSVTFRDISIYDDEEGDNGIIVMVEYSVSKGNKTEITKVAVKL
jgi:phage baseplate assembly protein W